jgi:hypothetical protein
LQNGGGRAWRPVIQRDHSALAESDGGRSLAANNSKMGIKRGGHMLDTNGVQRRVRITSGCAVTQDLSVAVIWKIVPAP